MSIRIAGSLVKIAHREGMERAARIVERMARIAVADNAYQEERLNEVAPSLRRAADKIRKSAKRYAALRDGGK